CLQGYITPLTF
nr:immunoglobulin light chain junction region [Macaca mulatta]